MTSFFAGQLQEAIKASQAGQDPQVGYSDLSAWNQVNAMNSPQVQPNLGQPVVPIIPLPDVNTVPNPFELPNNLPPGILVPEYLTMVQQAQNCMKPKLELCINSMSPAALDVFLESMKKFRALPVQIPQLPAVATTEFVPVPDMNRANNEPSFFGMNPFSIDQNFPSGHVNGLPVIDMERFGPMANTKDHLFIQQVLPIAPMATTPRPTFYGLNKIDSKAVQLNQPPSESDIIVISSPEIASRQKKQRRAYTRKVATEPKQRKSRKQADNKPAPEPNQHNFALAPKPIVPEWSYPIRPSPILATPEQMKILFSIEHLETDSGDLNPSMTQSPQSINSLMIKNHVTGTNYPTPHEFYTAERNRKFNNQTPIECPPEHAELMLSMGKNIKIVPSTATAASNLNGNINLEQMKQAQTATNNFTPDENKLATPETQEMIFSRLEYQYQLAQKQPFYSIDKITSSHPESLNENQKRSPAVPVVQETAPIKIDKSVANQGKKKKDLGLGAHEEEFDECDESTDDQEMVEIDTVWGNDIFMAIDIIEREEASLHKVSAPIEQVAMGVEVANPQKADVESQLVQSAIPLGFFSQQGSLASNHMPVVEESKIPVDSSSDSVLVKEVTKRVSNVVISKPTIAKYSTVPAPLKIEIPGLRSASSSSSPASIKGLRSPNLAYSFDGKCEVVDEAEAECASLGAFFVMPKSERLSVESTSSNGFNKNLINENREETPVKQLTEKEEKRQIEMLKNQENVEETEKKRMERETMVVEATRKLEEKEKEVRRKKRQAQANKLSGTIRLLPDENNRQKIIFSVGKTAREAVSDSIEKTEAVEYFLQLVGNKKIIEVEFSGKYGWNTFLKQVERVLETEPRPKHLLKIKEIRWNSFDENNDRALLRLIRLCDSRQLIAMRVGPRRSSEETNVVRRQDSGGKIFEEAIFLKHWLSLEVFEIKHRITLDLENFCHASSLDLEYKMLRASDVVTFLHKFRDGPRKGHSRLVQRRFDIRLEIPFDLRHFDTIGSNHYLGYPEPDYLVFVWRQYYDANYKLVCKFEEKRLQGKIVTSNELGNEDMSNFFS